MALLPIPFDPMQDAVQALTGAPEPRSNENNARATDYRASIHGAAVYVINSLELAERVLPIMRPEARA